MLTPVIAATRVALGAGGWAVQAPLLVHVAAGIAGIVTGYVALSVAKGGAVHRRIGTWFVWAMAVMGVVGAAIAAFEGKVGSVDGGLLSAYFVVTAMLTVRPVTDATRRATRGAMVVAVVVGLLNIAQGAATLAAGRASRDGVPVAAYFVFGAIALLASTGDARLLRRGALAGRPRLVRHLWRMCFALFIATGSFFIGQAHVLPAAIRIFPLLAVPAFAPLVAMVYWLVRLRVRRRVRGLVLRASAGASPLP